MGKNERNIRIQAKQLTMKYSEEVILNDINLEFEKNEITCVLGKSGSGKTTLLHLLSGFLQANEGEVILNGRRLRGPNRNIGVVLQNYGLFPWYTVYQNMAFGAKSKQDVMDYLKRFELEHCKDQYPSQLSGGMQQRVAVARTMLSEPQVLIMDEPFSAQDKITKSILYQELKDYASRTSATCIIVTHSMEEAMYLSDRILVVKNKKISLDLCMHKREWQEDCIELLRKAM